jgi:hypothetical protein
MKIRIIALFGQNDSWYSIVEFYRLDGTPYREEGYGDDRRSAILCAVIAAMSRRR